MNDIIIGRAVVPWDMKRKGWALPGQRTTESRLRAQTIAREIDRMMEQAEERRR